MIKTSRQLKDLIRNMAKGDSGKSQLLIRNYAMERFLERVSLSRYKDNFILKGGMLISAMVGLNSRATMDIDTTVKNMPLGVDAAKRIVEEIAAVPLDDFFASKSKMWPTLWKKRSTAVCGYPSTLLSTIPAYR